MSDFGRSLVGVVWAAPRVSQKQPGNGWSVFTPSPRGPLQHETPIRTHALSCGSVCLILLDVRWIYFALIGFNYFRVSFSPF